MTSKSLVQEIIELRKNLPKNFCPVPFTTIILEPDGKVGICRNKGNDFPIGQFDFENIDQIWDIRNSPKAQQWRKEFVEGNPLICQDEVTHRKCNLDLHFNDLLPDAQVSITQDSKILRLTANLNGRCNMQCPFCVIWKLPNNNYNDKNFWIPARTSLFPFLKQIDMLSGEPFIQADTYRLIDEVSAVNPDCSWIFTTNMYWNLNTKIEEKLEKITIKDISVSIDSFDEQLYSQLRFPGKLPVTMENLDKLLKYKQERSNRNKDFTLSFNFLVQQSNWRELPEVFRFAKKNQMEFVSILLMTPQKFSILNLSNDERRSIIDYYYENIPHDDLFKINTIIKPLLSTLDAIDRARYIDIIRNYLKPSKLNRPI